MPKVVLTLDDDTPNRVVSIHSDFQPAVGYPVSPAQMAALDTIVRINHQWNMQSGKPVPAETTLASAHPCHQTQVVRP